METQQNAFALEPDQISNPEHVDIPSLQAQNALLGVQKMLENVTLTQPRLADVIRSNSKCLNTGAPSTYLIPLIENTIDVKDCRSFYFGKENVKQNRIIMCMGATGAGKSTLINGMINYILGVRWDDSFRFKLIDEGQSQSQAESQTSMVTAYRINHQEGFQIPYSVTIIDTPGFGDTRGIERDREITHQLRRMFSSQLGVSHIDAICFVAQASLARLTSTQRYVFDSVLSIFGKDVAENIQMLVTFADGQKPPVLEAINAAGVPCHKKNNGDPCHFKFNNSALFADNTSSDMNEDGDDDAIDIFKEMFWNMGVKSMSNFFNGLSKMKTKSLVMTQEVLKERQQLENSIENMSINVKLGVTKLEEIKQTALILQTHNAAMKKSKEFKCEVDIMIPIQEVIPKGQYVTNCQQCSFTCHYPCPIPSDADKKGCAAMDSDGNCTECTGKCIWSVHFNQEYRWVYKQVKKRRTVEDLRQKYQKAKQEKITVQGLITRLAEEHEELQGAVTKLIEQSAKCLDRLNEIALKPNPLSTQEYIDMLIGTEKAECKAGSDARIQTLKDLKDKELLTSYLWRRSSEWPEDFEVTAQEGPQKP